MIVSQDYWLKIFTCMDNKLANNLIRRKSRLDHVKIIKVFGGAEKEKTYVILLLLEVNCSVCFCSNFVRCLFFPAFLCVWPVSLHQWLKMKLVNCSLNCFSFTVLYHTTFTNCKSCSMPLRILMCLAHFCFEL